MTPLKCWIASKLFSSIQVGFLVENPAFLFKFFSEGVVQYLSIYATLTSVCLFREQQKRLAALEMEIAAAKSQGYLAKHPVSQNTSANGGRWHSVIGIYTTFGNKARRDSIRKTWMSTGHHPSDLSLRSLFCQGVRFPSSWSVIDRSPSSVTHEFVFGCRIPDSCERMAF